MGRAMVLAGLAIVAAMPAIQAQTPPPEPTSAEIIVKAAHPDQEARAAAAVAAIGRPVSQGGFDAQFGRWEDPICVGVMGLPVEPAQFIADRIGIEARRLKITVEGPGCHPTIYIVATPQPSDFIARARGSRSGLLSNTTSFDIKQMERSHAVVRWIALTIGMGAKGNSFVPADSGTGARTASLQKITSASRIWASTRAVIARMIVVVDLGKVDGQAYKQLAAYLSMVTLAQLRPNADAPMVNTILAAFRPDGVAPDDLTDFDRAYLDALYTMPADLYGTLQKQAIVRSINRSLTQSAAH